MNEKLKENLIHIAVILSVISICLAGYSLNTARNLDESISAGWVVRRITTYMILDGAVSDTKLKASAIPNATDYETLENTTTGASFINTNSSVSITVNRNSMLIATFSTEAKANSANSTRIRCQVGGVDALPSGDINFTSSTGYNAKSFTFYNASLPAGTYTVMIQARTEHAQGIAYLINSSLVVYALPA